MRPFRSSQAGAFIVGGVLLAGLGAACSASGTAGGDPSDAAAGGVGDATTPSGDAIATTGDDGSLAFNLDGSGPPSPLGDAACAATTTLAKRSPAAILFVIDRSGSMNCNPPPVQASTQCEAVPTPVQPTQPTKWSIIRDALTSAVQAMPDNNLVGITYFSNDDNCGTQQTPNVAVSVLDATHRTALASSLGAVTPKGGTPIIGAVTNGYAYLHANTFNANEFLVLLTDGQESCAATQESSFLATTVTNAVLVGIKTFVLGAPGSEVQRAFLSQIAFNGGTARTATCTHGASPATAGDCHFDMTDPTLNFATLLNQALDAITRQALSCEFDVPSPEAGTIDYGKVNVSYTPSGGTATTTPQDNRPCDGGADGWQYNADRSKIILCGPTCTTVKNDPGAAIAIALGCTTHIR